MKNIVSIVIALLVGLAGGYAIRSQIGGPLPTPAAANRAGEKTAQMPPGSDQIYKVILGDAPTLGPADARVTVVEFSDFQCPYCGRVVPTVKEIEKTYGKDVRVVFKNNPLPMHPDAPGAARAAVAAWKQGKFWEMHDAMFAAQKTPDGLKAAGLEKIAQQIGLNVDKFKADIANPDTQQLVQSDQAQARQLGANGTPSFFINGAKVSGAMPFDSFKLVIDAAMKRADAKIAQGTPKADVYNALIANGLTSPPAPKDQPAPAAQAKKIDLDPAAPAKGGKSPKVEIVEWSDFQCPFCGRAEPTIKQIMDTYKDEVRIEWKNQPLPFHPNAMPAAKAAMAAHKQGKFWQMHDLMFQNQQALSDAKYEEWAHQAGLNVAEWKKDKESPEIAEQIKKDMAQGAAAGANGTPTFFINGKLVSGALPFESFKTIIDAQIAKADAELKKGTSKDKLYEALVEENVKEAGAAPANRNAAADAAPVKIDVGSSPARGGRSAQVTVVEWSDFQCPYCSRVEPTLNQLRAEYGDKVKWVWKNQPLPFHPNAMPAAEAALAAGDQGKFWEMHDKLFENQQKLSPELYDSLAKELGLNLDKFHADITSGKNKPVIQADMAAGAAAGAGGTPTFFINGHKLVGAQPADAFKQVIDAELSRAVAHK